MKLIILFAKFICYKIFWIQYLKSQQSRDWTGQRDKSQLSRSITGEMGTTLFRRLPSHQIKVSRSEPPSHLLAQDWRVTNARLPQERAYCVHRNHQILSNFTRPVACAEWAYMLERGRDEWLLCIAHWAQWFALFFKSNRVDAMSFSSLKPPIAR